MYQLSGPDKRESWPEIPALVEHRIANYAGSRPARPRSVPAITLSSLVENLSVGPRTCQRQFNKSSFETCSHHGILRHMVHTGELSCWPTFVVNSVLAGSISSINRRCRWEIWAYIALSAQPTILKMVNDAYTKRWNTFVPMHNTRSDQSWNNNNRLERREGKAVLAGSS